MIGHALIELRSVSLPNGGRLRRTPTYVVASTAGGLPVPEPAATE